MHQKIRHSSSAVNARQFRYIRKIAQRNFVGQGPLCQQLADRLGQDYDREAVSLTDSGEAALKLVFSQLKAIKPACTEVVVSAYVCSAVVNAILSCGLHPVFADVRADALNLSLEDVVKRRISERTLAIVCTHLGGFPDDIDGALQTGLPVISDCAQAIGAQFQGKSVLSFGRFSIVSFGPTKVITAGLGGAVLANQEDGQKINHLAQPELSVVEYQENGFVPTIGQHFCDLNAGLALAQIDDLPTFIDRRIRIAKKYTAILRVTAGVELPSLLTAATPNWFRYYFFSDQADAWIRGLQGQGIDARSSISHQMTEYFPTIGTRTNLSRLASRVVSLPIYSTLKASDVQRILRALVQLSKDIA